jgi:hypothetical protein
MTEVGRLASFEHRAFVDEMTSQEYGKYVLAVLGLREVRRFSKEGSDKHLDVLMPQDSHVQEATFAMLRSGGRIDRGALSPDEARNILEEMARGHQDDSGSPDA